MEKYPSPNLKNTNSRPKNPVKPEAEAAAINSLVSFIVKLPTAVVKFGPIVKIISGIIVLVTIPN